MCYNLNQLQRSINTKYTYLFYYLRKTILHICMYLQCNIYKGTHIHRPSLTKEMQTVLFLLFVCIFHAKNIKGPSECSSFTHYYEALSGAAQFNHSTPLLYKVFFTYLEKKLHILYCYTPGQDGPVPSFPPHQNVMSDWRKYHGYSMCLLQQFVKCICIHRFFLSGYLQLHSRTVGAVAGSTLGSSVVNSEPHNWQYSLEDLVCAGIFFFHQESHS